MARDSKWTWVASASLVVAAVLWLIGGTLIEAQTGKAKAKPKAVAPGEVKKLDIRMEDVVKSFQKDTASLIRDCEDAGQPERAKLLLEVLLKLDPKNDQLQKKIDALNEQILSHSEFEFELDVSKSWVQVGVVSGGRLARITADGDYKFDASGKLSADGVPAQDPANDMVAGIPLGSLMGVVMPSNPQPNQPNQPNRTNAGNQNRPPPFAVKSEHEWTPKQDGVLLLKVNFPPGTKCTGKLKLKVSGMLKAS
ncbi:MAG: hypothetical protein AABP62_04725 [Planctomycetota bacterium]